MKKTVDEMIMKINSISEKYFILPVGDRGTDEDGDFVKEFFDSRRGFAQPKVLAKLKWINGENQFMEDIKKV